MRVPQNTEFTEFLHTTPTLALPLMGRELFLSLAIFPSTSFPLRGKVGMGVVFILLLFVLSVTCG
jgi:hypothetical protein